ncbi:S-adenosyl-L-methionine-dependent methyltransferase [Mollisia scopiformis]|uniref:S-adenosyl-L-methionine-dependent methyltransferase n=1 Tax=Mollisia scopiformis TaxID=149040 RepID=A0A194WY98_MOLSC|nr:S-adenosyl-L-methionine-dependent methyltransferase [Mollisia scopiformis]KUJ12941.1 S-adenosyl-L-methionine-dependent methyltransferase [Mollisia scopiformis]
MLGIMSTSRIVELSCIIHEHTAKVDAYLESQKLPTPSFDTSYPAKVPLSPNIQSCQDAVLDAADELTALMLGPAAGSMSRYPHSAWASLQAIQRYGIAKTFSPTTSTTFGNIARACSLSESDTRRIVRAAMTYYIFREPSPGIVAHTAASKYLAEIPALGQLVGFLRSEMWPSAARMVGAMEKWPGSEEPNETGFALAYGTDIPMFDVVGRDPERAQRMAGAMEFMHSSPAYNVRHLLENFDWGDTPSGVLVDVGGGREQPVKWADVYYLRLVLHDWSDKYAIRILRNLIPALRKGARVLVSEICVPSPCTLSPYKERPIRNFDLSMKGVQNAK